MLRSIIIFLTLCVAPVIQLSAPSQPPSSAKQWVYITEGVGISDVLIDKSAEPDVVSRFGDKYKLITHNEYSREMEYADLGLSFYYCLKDKEKKIFLIEAHHGSTSKGIVIGQSTLKDIFDIYGEEEDQDCRSKPCVYEYKGIQFYLQAGAGLDPVDPLQLTVVEIDVVSPSKSSSFCDDL